MGSDWARGVPRSSVGPADSIRGFIGLQGELALDARVKAMHHWIRKGNAHKAALSARDAAHVVLAALARVEGVTR